MPQNSWFSFLAATGNFHHDGRSLNLLKAYPRSLDDVQYCDVPIHGIVSGCDAPPQRVETACRKRLTEVFSLK